MIERWQEASLSRPWGDDVFNSPIFEARMGAQHPSWDAIFDDAHRNGFCYFHVEGDLDPSGQPYLYKLTDTNGEYDIERYDGAA